MKEIGKKVAAPVIIILFTLLCLLIFIRLSGPLPFYVQNVNTVKDPLFTVQATGEVNTIPDTVLISVGVSKTAKTVEDAKSQVDTAINNITKEVKNLGIEEKNIKTTSYSITPKYDDNPTPIRYPNPLEMQQQTSTNNTNSTSTSPGEPVAEEETSSELLIRPKPISPPISPSLDEGDPRIIGYTAYARIEIKSKPIEKANQIYNIASKYGANRIGSPQFTVDDDKQKELQKEARNLAIKEAKEKASEISKISGLNLGKLLDVSEGGSYYPMYSRAYDMGASMDGEETAVTQLNPGETTVRTTVTLTYETY